MSVLGLEGTSKDKGFALKLRALAFDDTLKIGYNRKDLAAAMGLSAPTLRKKIAAVEKMGLWQDGLVEEYFPICERCYLTEENVEAVRDVINAAEKDSRTYKQMKWFLQNGLHKRRDANDRLKEVFAGVVGGKRTVERKVEKAVFEW